MCWGDLTKSKVIRSRIKEVGSGNKTVFNDDATRIGIRVTTLETAAGSQGFCIGFDVNSPFLVVTSVHPVDEINILTHGDLVMKGFTADATNLNFSLIVIEIYLENP